jgi:hypothetical protein
MIDGLDYIRKEIAEKGKKGRVTVVRWEIDPRTGAQDIPIKLQVNAMLALKELQKPINKRSFSWSRIRPLGQEPFKEGSIDEGSLSDPILRAKLKDALRAEIEAEIKAETGTSLESSELVEAPKKKKKKVELEVSDEPVEESDKPEPTEFNSYL